MLRSLAGGSLFGETWGDGRPAVMALHGWRRSHADFTLILGPSAQGGALPAVAPDLPGFGATPPPPSAWGAAEYAAAVARLLGDEDRPPAAVVVGHSLGGRVAVALAARRPELVGALVLSGAPLLPGPGVRRRAPAAYRVLRGLNRVGLAGEARLERARRRYGSADYQAAEGVMRGVLVRLVNERYEDDLAALRCPVELVWGDDDTEVPLSVAESIASRVPGSVLTVCPGAGHLTPLTAPEQLRAAIERALARRST